MIWGLVALVVGFGLYWVWWSAPSQRQIDTLRESFIEGAGGAELAKIPKRHQLDTMWQVMRDLLLDDHFEAGRRAVRVVSELDPVAATVHAEMVAEATGDVDFGVEICERALEANPNSVSALGALARILADGGRIDDALAVLDRRADEPDLAMLRADLLEQTGRIDEALDLAEKLEAFGAANANLLLDQDELMRADQMRSYGASKRREIQAELDPDFDPLKDLADSGQLKPRSGGNHAAIGARIHLDAPPNDARLEHPTSMAKRAFDVLEQFPKDHTALCEAGEAQVRTRDAARAAKLFTTAVRDDPTDHVAQRGLGFALLCEEERWLTGLGGLPEANVPVPSLFPDLAALTEDEQRILTASVGELASRLSSPIRIRPLAYVPADGDPPFVVACDLLDLSAAGWALAQVVAVLAFAALDDAEKLAVMALMDEVRDRPELSLNTDLDDLPAFFAQAWVHTVRARWSDDASHDLLSRRLPTILSASR